LKTICQKLCAVVIAASILVIPSVAHGMGDSSLTSQSKQTQVYTLYSGGGAVLPW